MQVLALVAGVIGAVSGITALVLRLLENYRRPRVRLLQGLGSDDSQRGVTIEVVNPALIPLIVREAGVIMAGKRWSIGLSDLGDRPSVIRRSADDWMSGDGTKRSITVRARGACIGPAPLWRLQMYCESCGVSGTIDVVGYCDTGPGKTYRTRALRVDVTKPDAKAGA